MGATEGWHAEDFCFDQKNLFFSTFCTILKKQNKKKKIDFSIFFAFEKFTKFSEMVGPEPKKG